MEKIINVKTLSARIRQIIKLWSLTELMLDPDGFYYVDPYQKHGSFQLAARAVLGDAANCTELPERIVFSFEKLPEYSLMSKAKNYLTRQPFFEMASGEWSNGHMLIDGPLPAGNLDKMEADTTVFKQYGEAAEVNTSVVFSGCYQANGLYFHADYLDFIIKNTKTSDVLTFSTVNNSFLQVWCNGAFLAAICHCDMKDVEDMSPQLHKSPKQSKSGILHKEATKEIPAGAPLPAEMQAAIDHANNIAVGELEDMTVDGFDPAVAIQLVADDISLLRIVDIDRLLWDVGMDNMETMRRCIVKHHSDNQRILDALHDSVFAITAWKKSKEERTLKSTEPENPAALETAPEIEEQPENQLLQFQPGKTYYTRSICDHNCIYSVTIASRTAKTVTTTAGKKYRPGISWDGKAEELFPHGRYSMAACISAGSTERPLADWEKPAPAPTPAGPAPVPPVPLASVSFPHNAPPLDLSHNAGALDLAQPLRVKLRPLPPMLASLAMRRQESMEPPAPPRIMFTRSPSHNVAPLDLAEVAEPLEPYNDFPLEPSEPLEVQNAALIQFSGKDMAMVVRSRSPAVAPAGIAWMCF